jgi:glycolate oxidase
MAFITKTFYSVQDLASHIKTHRPSFYFSSKTSTVIPYDKLESLLPWNGSEDFILGDLSKLPPHMEVKPNGNLIIQGAVSWQDAKIFLKSKGLNLKTSPTEQLALVTAGLATSCTGERCFGFGTMRSQVVALKYLDFNGEEISLNRDENFSSLSEYLKKYSKFDIPTDPTINRFKRKVSEMSRLYVINLIVNFCGNYKLLNLV